MSGIHNKNAAIAFARCLDDDDFVVLHSLLTEDCVYEIGDERLLGPESICNSYESSMRSARAKLDQVIWGKSSVKKIGDGCMEIYISDHICHRGINHVHYCKQKIWLNDQDLIERIQHIELPGEQEALKVFYDKVGL